MVHFQAENLSFAYPDSPQLWENLSFTLRRGSFNLLLGPAGAGKSTLLRHFIPKLRPFGSRSGRILCKGEDLYALSETEQVEKIAFVMQNPEDQIVCDSVWHELAFGPENLGLSPAEMRLRIAEVANFFGIQSWFEKRTYELSGGQKRVLNLASVLVLRPELLILDEPLSQLDPIAASDFVSLLLRVNRELGITILISEHMLSHLAEAAEQILYLEGGKMEIFSSPEAFAEMLFREQKPYRHALPDAALIAHALGRKPLTFRIQGAKEMAEEAFSSAGSAEARRALLPPSPSAAAALDFASPSAAPAALDSASSPAAARAAARESHYAPAAVSAAARASHSSAAPPVDSAAAAPAEAPTDSAAAAPAEAPADSAAAPDSKAAAAPAVECRNLCFRYGIKDDWVLDHLNLKIPAGQISFIMGGNASGKSTLLNVLAGLLQPENGKVLFPDNKTTGSFFAGRRAARPALALLPQNPRLLFTGQSLEEDFGAFAAAMTPEQRARISEAYFSGAPFAAADFARLFGLEDKWKSHPADLSGGEQQRAGLAAVLLQAPDILLLDEPSKALTAADKAELGRRLQQLCQRGLTVAAVSHDLDFAARFASRCFFLFRGEIISEAAPRDFFSGQYFYTTDTGRICAQALPGAVIPEEVSFAWQKLNAKT